MSSNASTIQEKGNTMKRLMIIISIGAIMLGCSGENNDNGQAAAVAMQISGEVRGGYRQIPINVSTDTLDLMVYRGDYIKFFLNDGGDPQVDYTLDIPELQVSTVLKDNTDDQPYFKMKKSGTFQFRIGDQLGLIKVVELEQKNYAELSSEEAWKLMNESPPFVLDVRTQPEFYRGYLKGATLVPLQELQYRVNELEQYKNHPIMIYCATGNRSTTAAKILLDAGFKDIMNLRTGIVGWASKGYNVQFR